MATYTKPRILILLLIFLVFIIISGLTTYLMFFPSFLNEEIEDLITDLKNKVCRIDEDCYTGNITNSTGIICLHGRCVYETCDINEFVNYTDSDTCCGVHGTPWYGKCLCDDYWSGEICDISCNSCGNGTNQTCENDGDCEMGICWYDKCFCENPNYWGDYCELVRRDLSICYNDEQCLNGGKCVENIGGIGGECYCPISTISDYCQVYNT